MSRPARHSVDAALSVGSDAFDVLMDAHEPGLRSHDSLHV